MSIHSASAQDRFLRRTFCFSLVAALLLITAPRLPAPISEVPQATPTPKPKREATSNPKRKSDAKPKASPTLSFAGTWSGSTINSSSTVLTKVSALYVIKISDDQKTVLINWSPSGKTIRGLDYQATCIRLGSALSWSLKQVGATPTWACTDTLRLNNNGTASFVREGSYIAGDYQGAAFNNTGTLSRR